MAEKATESDAPPVANEIGSPAKKAKPDPRAFPKRPVFAVKRVPPPLPVPYFDHAVRRTDGATVQWLAFPHRTPGPDPLPAPGSAAKKGAQKESELHGTIMVTAVSVTGMPDSVVPYCCMTLGTTRLVMKTTPAQKPRLDAPFKFRIDGEETLLRVDVLDWKKLGTGNDKIGEFDADVKDLTRDNKVNLGIFGVFSDKEGFESARVRLQAHFRPDAAPDGTQEDATAEPKAKDAKLASELSGVPVVQRYEQRGNRPVIDPKSRSLAVLRRKKVGASGVFEWLATTPDLKGLVPVDEEGDDQGKRRGGVNANGGQPASPGLRQGRLRRSSSGDPGEGPFDPEVKLRAEAFDRYKADDAERLHAAMLRAKVKLKRLRNRSRRLLDRCKAAEATAKELRERGVRKKPGDGHAADEKEEAEEEEDDEDKDKDSDDDLIAARRVAPETLEEAEEEAKEARDNYEKVKPTFQKAKKDVEAARVALLAGFLAWYEVDVAERAAAAAEQKARKPSPKKVRKKPDEDDNSPHPRSGPWIGVYTEKDGRIIEIKAELVFEQQQAQGDEASVEYSIAGTVEDGVATYEVEGYYSPDTKDAVWWALEGDEKLLHQCSGPFKVAEKRFEGFYDVRKLGFGGGPFYLQYGGKMTEQPCKHCGEVCTSVVVAAHEDACPKRPMECSHCGELYTALSVATHEGVCEKRGEACEFCKAPVQFKRMPVHIANCPERPKACRFCDELLAFKNAKSHELVCDKRSVPCKYCVEPIPRKNISEHRLTCDKRPQLCQFCDSEVMARDLKSHEETCDERRQACQFCSLLMVAYKIPKHEEVCRNKAKTCRFCSNTFVIRDDPDHEINCELRPEKCRHCNELFTLTALPEHSRSCGQRPETCKWCSKAGPAAAAREHAQACGMRPVPCQHCNDTFPAKRLSTHETGCAQRPVPCPDCEEEVLQGELPAHQRVCEQKQVKCPDCHLKLLQGELPDHQLGCSRHPAKCPDCNASMLAGDLPGHQKGCDKRPVRCPDCKKDMRAHDLPEHQKGCERRPVACKHCRKKIPVSELEAHMQTCEAGHPVH